MHIYYLHDYPKKEEKGERTGRGEERDKREKGKERRRKDKKEVDMDRVETEGNSKGKEEKAQRKNGDKE